MQIYYYTFGCKVNQYETDRIEEAFRAEGHDTALAPEEAEVFIINTCTVTAQADRKLTQLIHRLRRESGGCVIALAGCFPQAFGEKARGLGADILAGNRSKFRLPELVQRFFVTGEPVVDIPELSSVMEYEKDFCPGQEKRTRGYIKIQDGCDRYCTYCIIPYARGHIRSKPLEDIVEEAGSLITSGHRELILTGINLCFYGADLREDVGIIDVAEAVCGIEGDHRVRLGSIEPEIISEADIRRLSALPGLCPHFHLSLQSGCTATLERMGRGYTAEDYAGLVRRLRDSFPGCSITTDIMVGFPGETEEEFQSSARFVRDIGFAQAHIFPYSRRPGTPAADMPGQIPKAEKHRRAGIMSRICAESRDDYMKGFIGHEVRVLFEWETSPDWHGGHSDEYLPVRIPRLDPELSLRRRYGTVRITAVQDEWCIGELMGETY